jgi:transcriptional regulator with XRE-family HTH domain
MPASDVPELGERIRAQRLNRGLSLRSLAREVGVSASMISQIETGKAQPSVSTLYAITSVLRMSIHDLFEAPVAAGLPASVPVVRRPIAGLQAAGNAPGLPLGPLVHPHERQVLTLDSGVTWERLGSLPGHDVDFLLVTYAPGGTSSSTGDLMRHPGSEYGFLLSGELVLTLGFDDMVVRPGDAICFESTTPHRYRNDRTEPAVGIWYVLDEGAARMR